jgi:serine/threonine protein kinase
MRGIGEVSRVLLADFGIGKVMEASGTLSDQTMAGTPGYMAPEILSGTYDPLKCDVYAFGILALALLCGVEPAAMKMCFGQPLPFELTEVAQQRADEDDEFNWLVEHVYRTCASCDATLRPGASVLWLTLEAHPLTLGHPLSAPYPASSSELSSFSAGESSSPTAMPASAPIPVEQQQV